MLIIQEMFLTSFRFLTFRRFDEHFAVSTLTSTLPFCYGVPSIQIIVYRLIIMLYATRIG